MDRIKMGSFLTELRKEKDLSQTALAEIIGVTFQAVSKWERGEAIPDISILEKLASFYNVSIDEIIKGEASVQQEKVIDKQEVIVETNKTKETSGFLHQKRIFGFWFSLVYFLLFFLIGFCPFASAKISTSFSETYITASYYRIVFSSNFQIGNFFLLVQFLTTLGIIACTMLYFACTTKKAFRTLYVTRFVLIIVNLLTLLMNIVFFFNDTSGVGVYLLFIIILVFDILYLTLKQNRKSYISQDFRD